MGIQSYSSTHDVTRVGDTSPTLTLRKYLLVLIKQEVEWAPERVWML